MKSTATILTTALLLSLSGAAYATKPPKPDVPPPGGGWWNDNRNENTNTNTNKNTNTNTNKNTNTNTNTNTNNNTLTNTNTLTNKQAQEQAQAQHQGQAQGQQQGIHDSGNSSSTSGASSSSGGNTTTSGSTVGASGNSSVSVDASDRSTGDVYSAQTLFIPTVQAAAPAMVAGANVVVDRGLCGPMMDVVSEDVQGIYLGMFSRRNIYLGKTDRLVSHAGGTYRQEGGRLYGHRPVSYVAVIGVAGSRSIGIGGGKTGGDWGNAGASGGSSMQRMVVQTNLEPCEAFHAAPAQPARVVQGSDIRG